MDQSLIFPSNSRGRKMKPSSPATSTKNDLTNVTSVPMKARHSSRSRQSENGELDHNAAKAFVRSANASCEFSCDVCASPYVVNPCRRSGKKPKQRPTPRHRIDPDTKKWLNLCNACGLASANANSKSKKSPKDKKLQLPHLSEQKQSYLSEASNFARNLVKEYNDGDAERLFCPQVKKTACGCIQNYVSAEGDREESRKRGLRLLQLIKEAKRLSSQKCYDIEDVKLIGCNGHASKGLSRRARYIGLGNGQKKSKMFEEFVLQNRSYLRDSLKFCERATQKVLIYSNNFLHKKLKTVPERLSRVKRQKGKAAMGLLVPIEIMQRQQCCGENCVSLAVTHGRLLQHWRERVSMGQAEARRVLAEMLTPSGGARSNCYKFISMVTGCSNTTICRVNEQMKVTGGDREPPQHGLKKWFEENPRSRINRSSVNSDGEKEIGSGSNNHNATRLSENVDFQDGAALQLNAVDILASASQNGFGLKSKSSSRSSSPSSSWEAFSKLQLQRQQLIQLQSQLAQQQRVLEQKQQLVEQQLQQHILQRNNHPIIRSVAPTTGVSQTSVVSRDEEHLTTSKVVAPNTLAMVKPPHEQSSALLNNDTIQNLTPTRMIVDVPCPETGNVISFSLSLSEPPLGEKILSANDVNVALPSNLNITVLPQQVNGSADRLELPAVNSTLGNLILIQPSSENVIDAIPVVINEPDC